MRLQLPRPVQSRINHLYARWFGVDLSEAVGGPEDYESLAAFFVRPLKEGARHWPSDPGSLASPADGILGQSGELDAGTALQAKGVSYDVSELFGEPSRGSLFRSGLYLTIYLSPRHYHRVHAPCAGQLHTAWTVPGRLLPVHPAGLASVRGLLPQNERLVTLMETRELNVAVVAIGAFNVGSIGADFDSEWGKGLLRGVTNASRGDQSVSRSYAPPLELERGDPLMTFHFGSTVVLLLSPKTESRLALRDDLDEGVELRLGSPLTMRDAS